MSAPRRRMTRQEGGARRGKVVTAEREEVMRLTRDVLGAVVLGLAAVGAASAANISSKASAQRASAAKATEHLSKSGSVTFAPGNLSLGATLPANPALELSHGYELLQDLDNGGAVPATEGTTADDYKISQKPFSSYEAVVDSTSGDIQPVQVNLIANDGTTVLASGQSIGTGFSRSLRFMNNTATEINDETVRVTSGGCSTDCGPDDVYFIRGYETTYSVPRFNNAGTQITVLLLQNPTNYSITGNIYFWNTAGTQVASQGFTLGGKQLQVLNTSTVPGANGIGGAVTIVNDGRYGDLSAKTVALEPATGFSFDSPALPRIK
jgi:hypothetical protein